MLYAATIVAYQNNVRYARKSTEVVIARKKAGVAVAKTKDDISQRPLRQPGSGTTGQILHPQSDPSKAISPQLKSPVSF